MFHRRRRRHESFIAKSESREEKHEYDRIFRAPHYCPMVSTSYKLNFTPVHSYDDKGMTASHCLIPTLQFDISGNFEETHFFEKAVVGVSPFSRRKTK